MESSIKFTFKKVLENYSNVDKCKEIIKEFYKEIKSTQKENPEFNSLLIHNLTKIVRTFYQEHLIKILDSQTNQYREYGINMTNIIIWMSEEDMIDYSSFLVIMEDILETFPIQNLEEIFNIIEKNIKTKSYSNFTDNRKLTLLKISNSILKRLSSGNDTKFRGRVQMLLATTFPVGEKSGVNQKGLYNPHTTASPPINQEKPSILNPRFYKQFWTVIRYLANPFLLFSSQPSDESEELQLLDDKLDTSRVISIEPDISIPKLDIVLNNISKIITYFDQHQINLNEKSDTILSYPKYLTSQDLFELQLNDSSFRKTVITQFYIVLKSFLRPISQAQKKAFVLTENEKKKVNELLTSLETSLISSGIFDKIKKVFKQEESWENWKESGCPSYEKFPNEELKKNLAERVNRIKDRPSKYKNIKTKGLFKIENAYTYDFNKNFEVNLNDLKNIKANFAYSESLNGENPFLGNYVERVLRDNDPQMEIDEAESIINNDETFAWKLLRLVSLNDISRLNNESKVSTIIKEYADKYGKQIKFNIKDPLSKSDQNVDIANNIPNSSTGDIIIVEEREPSREPYRIPEKDAKLMKKKRSLDRSEKSYSDSYKKRKLD